jgi:Tol biopolymer transport system component
VESRRFAVRRDAIVTLDCADNPKYFPYRWGQAFWAYVGGRWGDDVIRKLLAVAAAAGDVDVAIQEVIGLKTKDLSDVWQTAIRAAYDPLLASTRPPGDEGHVVIKGSESAGDLNVGPAVSPDGQRLALLSSRSLVSTDLYIANARTGEILRKLTSTATNPHFSSIQFIESAGGWDHASRRLVIAAIVSGRPALAIFDVESGNKNREIRLGTLDQIINPSWAPDDHAICFSGMVHGVTDPFVYDLTTSNLQGLTNDAFADLQLSWSPDGRRIAFVTDRFSTNLDTVAIGRYQLAEIDAFGGPIRALRTFGDADSINPQWSRDGRSIYFISNRTGIPNLYRRTMATGALAQLTNLGTGISGITASSPALSVAAGSNVAAFSVYERGGYDIYTLDPRRRGGPLTPVSSAAATLPPLDRKPSEIAALLENPTLGLPPHQTYRTNEYRPSLLLEGIGQPVVALGVDRFGPAVGGGISLYFGDMLGNHTLAAAVQANSGFGGSFSAKDLGGQMAYFNQAHRWQWGAAGGQAPYLSGGFDSAIGTTPGGEPVQVDRTTVFRQTERSGTLIAAYPFNRAQRIELQGGMSRISFDQTTETAMTSLVTGQLLSDTTAVSSVASSVTLGTASAALVWDTASFGATSPVQGQRYRLEAAPAFGTINFTNVLADYRRYFMPAPFYTLAARVLHDGRYGSGAEDPRLFPMYLGYPTLVRGYDINTFSASDCVPTATSQCPAIDRLLGSRMLVGNLEFRFPLLRPFSGASPRMYGPLPVEVALFADGGVAWNAGESPALVGGTRHGVWSAGAALRVNLFG